MRLNRWIIGSYGGKGNNILTVKYGSGSTMLSDLLFILKKDSVEMLKQHLEKSAGS